jgi:hypothetical protein
VVAKQSNWTWNLLSNGVRGRTDGSAADTDDDLMLLLMMLLFMIVEECFFEESGAVSRTLLF